MANFDTQAKRFSGMGLGADEAPLLPKPDGTIAQGDRQHFLDLYSGILAAAPTTPTGDAIGGFVRREWRHPEHQPAAHSPAWSFALPRLSLGGLT